jgi:hypothetical protein
MEIKETEQFSLWAKGYSGCDGGNIDGAIWFCGIEYGGNEDEKSFKFNDVSQPMEIPDDEREGFLKFQYNIKVAKIYTAILGEDVSRYFKTVLRDKLFAQESHAFKMNLYPISFHHDSDDLWQEWLFRKTGLPTKSIYKAWCQLYRFPEIRKWVKNYSPKLIITTGITYQNEFIMAFDGVETIFKGTLNTKNLSGRDFVWSYINENKTVLAITPFFGGRYGLNSDKLIQDFGNEIQSICKSKFGDHWLR